MIVWVTRALALAIHERQLAEHGGGTGVRDDRIGRRRTGDPMVTREAVSLADYREKYALYHTDLRLLEVRRRFPLLAIWDDHEVANDAWAEGAAKHNEGEGDWSARRAACWRSCCSPCIRGARNGRAS